MLESTFRSEMSRLRQEDLVRERRIAKAGRRRFLRRPLPRTEPTER
jgi:hypothetical protein